MNEKTRFGMRIVTSEIRIDDLLNRILNGMEDAQKPVHSPRWDIRTDSIIGNRFDVESKWGGCLYGGFLENS